MLASSIPSKISTPFANSGTKNTIPVPSQTGGASPWLASFTDGFPPLTRTPIASGGIPPEGADMNGILYQITAVQQWQSAGGVFKYDSAFSTAIGGYPAGAILLSSNGVTQWLNLSDNNTTDPDAGGANWAALSGYGITAVTGLTNLNVTLTAAQYGKSIITLAGTLTGNVQIIFPTTQQRWLVLNNTSGAFTVTCKTASGTGGIVQTNGIQEFYGDGTNLVPIGWDSRYSGNSISAIQSLTVIASSNQLTATYAGGTLGFRSGSLNSGTSTTITVPSTFITIPTGATLGAINGVAARFVWAIANNGGTGVLCVANIAGGLQMDETNLISPTTISAGATSANTWYSASSVAANSAYRIIGISDNTQATAGTYATQPSLVQGVGGQALTAMSSLGYGQTWQNVTGSRVSGTTYYNTTGKPIFANIYAVISPQTQSISVNGLTVSIGTAISTTNQTCAAIIPSGASYVYTYANTAGIYELR